MEDLPNSSTCPNLLKNQISGKRASGAYMSLFGMCAITEHRAGAGPSDRNGQSRRLLNGARGWGHYCHAVLAPGRRQCYSGAPAQILERQAGREGFMSLADWPVPTRTRSACRIPRPA